MPKFQQLNERAVSEHREVNAGWKQMIYQEARIIVRCKLDITMQRSAQSIRVTMNGVEIHLLVGQQTCLLVNDFDSCEDISTTL